MSSTITTELIAWPEHELAPPTSPRAHLLLGLGNPVIRSLIAEHLRCHGYHVSEFSDGRTLQRRARGTARWPRPNLVAVDIELQGRAGLELLIELRAKGINTPFLMLARDGRRKLVRDARHHQRVVVLETPFDLDELVAAVATLLGSS